MESSINFNFKDITFSNAIDHFKVNSSNSIENTEDKEKWLKILQLFFYSNKIDDEKYKVLNNKVLTYLYTGKLGDGKFTVETRDLLIDGKKKEIKDHFSDANNLTYLINKKNFFLKLYKLYLNILHNYFSKIEKNKTYGKILIYEAPPFKEEPNVVEHFLLNGDKYLNAITEASGKQFLEKLTGDTEQMVNSFIASFSDFKTKITLESAIEFNKKALKDTNKDNERKVFINKLISMYTAVYPDNIPDNFVDKIMTFLTGTKKKDALRFDGDEKTKWEVFLHTLKTGHMSIEYNKENLLSNLEKAVTSEIVYIDLILAPIHIDSELRKAWSTKDEFLFDNKTLPVILLEWAIEHFKHEIRDIRKDGLYPTQLFSTNCLIAMGTPLNTSVSIYEHFVDEMLLIDEYNDPSGKLEKNYIDLTQLNSPTAFRKFKNRGQGVVFPMFKSNVIGGSRYPDAMLVKHAFDIPDK